MVTLPIAPRFNGPPGSGNGGYTCGLIASLIGDGAEVTLRQPPPLDTPLAVSVVDGITLVHHGEVLIAEGRLVAWDLEVPTPPTMDEAAEAATRYVGFDHHEFPTCFTCGIDRDDGLEIWPGKVAGSELVASPWAAPDGVAPFGGDLPPEIVWAALDCPGAWVSARHVDRSDRARPHGGTDSLSPSRGRFIRLLRLESRRRWSQVIRRNRDHRRRGQGSGICQPDMDRAPSGMMSRLYVGLVFTAGVDVDEGLGGERKRVNEFMVDSLGDPVTVANGKAGIDPDDERDEHAMSMPPHANVVHR